MSSYGKRCLITVFILLFLLGGVWTWRGHAQLSGPLFIICRTDSTTQPPDVLIYSSVIDPASAQSIEGLEASAFEVQESGVRVSLTDVSYRPIGLAIVVVVDRGGISAPGDPRIRETTNLVRELIQLLSVTGAAEDDIIAIVGVGQGGVLQLEENFTYDPVDTNLVLNALVAMEEETVQGGTSLYEGLDEALRLLQANPDVAIREVLSHRRKVIIVFSDGVDRNYSDEAREQDIIRKATEASISIYSIGMAPRGRGLAPDGEVNLKRLAAQTAGLYFLHNSDSERQRVLAFFDRLMTQRNQYVLSYTTHQPKGASTPLRVTVNTDAGSSEKEVTFSSVLKPIRLNLTAPQDGLEISIPFSSTLRRYAGSLNMSVTVDTPDGVARTPGSVGYFVNGEWVGDGTAPPDYPFTWDPGDGVPVTTRAQVQEFTIYAETSDPYLGTRAISEQAKVRATYEAPPLSWRARLWLQGFWWIFLTNFLLLIGLLMLLVILFQTRSQLAQRITTTTSSLVRSVTRRLGTPAPASAKLVIIGGLNVGREFRLASTVVKVGRDPQFCDFALYDEYVSNPHFSILQDHAQFYIVDEWSTNGTRVNGMPIPPSQRIPLPPDAIIEAGQIWLQFRQLGGTTQQIGQPGAPPPPAAPGAYSGPTEKVV